MRIPTSTVLAVAMFAGTLFGQTPVVVVSGKDKPEVSINRVELHPPDYDFDLQCQGGPWRFRISGAPDFSPAPILRTDNWFDCPELLHVRLAATHEPVELTLASATGSGQAGVSTVVQILSQAPPPQGVPPHPNRFLAGWAVFCGALGLFTGLVALGIALRCCFAWKAADRSAEGARAAQDRAGRSFDDVSSQLVQVQTAQQAMASFEMQVTSLRNDLDKLIARFEERNDRVHSQATAPPSPETGDPLSVSDSPRARKSESVGPLVLFKDVQRWRARAEKQKVELPAQLLTKIQELQQLADSADAGNPPLASVEWRDLAFAVVSLTADHTDQYLDPHRSSLEWQTMLKQIFKAAGAEEIFPPHNAPVNEVEHYTVAAMPQQSPGDLPDHVARLRQRGFRMDGDLLRKAAVVVFR
ncbi:MAG: hypothetical protein ABSH52_10125 [Terriglobia bacterium]